MNRIKNLGAILAIALLLWGGAQTADAQRKRDQAHIPLTHTERMHQLLSQVAPKNEDGAYAMLQQVNLHILKLRANMGLLKSVLLHTPTEANKERLEAYEKTAVALALIQKELTTLMSNTSQCLSQCAQAEKSVAHGEETAEDHHRRMREFSSAAVKSMEGLKKSVDRLVVVQAGTKDPMAARFSKILAEETSALGRVVEYCDTTVKGLPQPVANKE